MAAIRCWWLERSHHGVICTESGGEGPGAAEGDGRARACVREVRGEAAPGERRIGHGMRTGTEDDT